MTSPGPVPGLTLPCRVQRQSCSLSALCLPLVLSPEEAEQLNAIARPLATLHKRNTLFSQDAVFRNLFLLRSGSLKQVTVTDSDEEQITHFFLPGELIGLDGIGEQRYPGSAIALETATVSEIPFERLDSLPALQPALRNYLYRLMSQEMHNERLVLRLMLSKTSDVRLASFFVAMSMRFQRRGYSPYCFRLAMSHGDIGNYLGLAAETISRLLGRFQRHALLSTQRREVLILDLPALTRLADGQAPGSG